MKKLLFLMIVLFVSIITKADDAVIRCSLPDGTMLYFVMGDKPTVKFEGEALIITSKDQNVSVDLSEGAAVTFSFIDGSTSILDSKRSLQPTFHVTEESIEATNLVPLSPIYIYDVKGNLLLKETVQSNGTIIIPLNGKGIFVVKTSVSSFKIRK